MVRSPIEIIERHFNQMLQKSLDLKPPNEVLYCLDLAATTCQRGPNIYFYWKLQQVSTGSIEVIKDQSHLKNIVELVNSSYASIQHEFYAGNLRTNLAEVQSVFENGIWLTQASATDSNQIVGTCGIEVKQEHWEVCMLSTLPSQQGVGIARAIMKQALSEAIPLAKPDYIEVDIVDYADRTSAYGQKLLKFYTSLGFNLYNSVGFGSVYPGLSKLANKPLLISKLRRWV